MAQVDRHDQTIIAFRVIPCGSVAMTISFPLHMLLPFDLPDGWLDAQHYAVKPDHSRRGISTGIMLAINSGHSIQCTATTSMA